jgi:uncharacterized protein (TIGR02996 family)
MTAEELIAAIMVRPQSLEAWLVYADWLLDRGDVRGELIHLAMTAETDASPGASMPGIAARIHLLHKEEEALLSPRLCEQAHFWRFEWWRGFVRAVELVGGNDDPPGLEAVYALVADPHAGLLESVTLVHPITATLPMWQPLLDAERPRVKTLSVTNLGDGSARLANVPALERLTLAGRAPVERLEHDRVHVLVAEAGSCPAALTGKLRLPALEYLEWSSADHDLRLLDAPRSFLYERIPPKLVELTLRGAGDALVAAVADSPLLRQLQRLELGASVARDLDSILAHAGAFSHLATLEVARSRDAVRPVIDAAAVDEWRAKFQRAFPNTRIRIAWDDFGRPAEPS